jgi:hypothetical protein
LLVDGRSIVLFFCWLGPLYVCLSYSPIST